MRDHIGLRSSVAGFGLGTAMMALPETGWLTAEHAKVVFWIGVVFALAGFVGFTFNLKNNWYRMWSISLNRTDRLPFRKFLSLEDAAIYASRKLQSNIIGKAADRFSKSNPRRWIVEHMKGSGKVPLYGFRPHSTKIERISEDEIGWCEISDDLSRLETPDLDPRSVFVDLRVKHADIKNYVKETRNLKGFEDQRTLRMS